MDFKFTTRTTTGAPTTLSGTPAVSVYQTNSTTETTTGVTLTVDFDSRTGLNHVRIDLSSDGSFYAAGRDFSVVITTGTVGGTSVVGEVVATFSVLNRSALRPTTAGRTLDVSVGGEAGLDWANVGSPTTTLSLTGTTVNTVTTVTNQLTAASIASGVWQDATGPDFTAANSVGKSLYNAFTANTSVFTTAALANGPTGGSAPTAAQVATAVWTDTTAGDFTTALSVGKSVMNGVTLGTGLTIARCTLTDTLTTYTGNTPQTGDAYARLGAPSGASVSADIAAISTATGAGDLTTKVADSATLTTGSTISGTYASTATNDDVYWITAPAGAAVGGFGLRQQLVFNLPLGRAVVSVQVRGWWNGTGTADLYARNERTAAFDKLTNAGTNLASRTTELLYTIPLPRDYADNSGGSFNVVTLELRATSVTTANRLRLDQVLVAHVAEASSATLIAPTTADIWSYPTRDLTTPGVEPSVAPTAAEVSDAVWDEARSGHVASGSFGEYTIASLADGVAHGGVPGSSTATLSMSRLVVESKTTNQPAVSLLGNGSGAGMLVEGGDSGHGLWATGGGSAGDGAFFVSPAAIGLEVTGQSQGVGISTNNGQGVYIGGGSSSPALELSGTGAHDVVLSGDGVLDGKFSAAGLAAFFLTDSTKVYADAVTGSVVKEVATNSSGGGGGITASDVWAYGTRTLTDKDGYTLTADERTAIANEVEAQIIDETDSEKVLTAITDKIASVNPSLSGLTLSAIATSVWASGTRTITGGTVTTNSDKTGYSISGTKTTLDGLNDVTVSAVAAQITTDHGSGSYLSSGGLTQADVRDAVGLATANLDTQLSGINSKTTNLPGSPAASGDIPSAEVVADTTLRRAMASVEVSSDGDALSLGSLYGFIQMAQESRVVGTTMTVYETDGTTVLGTRVLIVSAGASPIVGIQ